MTEQERHVLLEDELAALREARHMLHDHAKGTAAMYLDHAAYQDVIAFIDGRIALTLYRMMKERFDYDTHKSTV